MPITRLSRRITAGLFVNAMAVMLVAGTAPPVRAADHAPGQSSKIRVRVIDVGGRPTQVAIDPRRGTAWVATGRELVRIREATQRVTARVRFGGSLIAVDPRTGTVWAIDQDDSVMAEVSEATNRVIRRYTHIGRFLDIGTLGGVAADPRTGMVWVASWFSLDQISEASHRVVHSIPLRDNGADQQTGGVAVDPATNTIWVPIVPDSDRPARTWVSEINGATHRIVRNYITSGDTVVAVDSGRGEVWASTLGVVQVIAESTRRVARILSVSPNHGWLAAAIDSRRKIVLADSGDSVLVVSETSGKVLHTVPLALYPADVAVDPSNGSVYAPIVFSGVVSEFRD
jgi:DNA-binding beta-propeller fold protein YncE